MASASGLPQPISVKAKKGPQLISDTENCPAWGILGAEHATSSRRVRTLEVGSAVRTFNDLAVPGMGGVWFGKQLMLATLGVAVAGAARAAGMRVHNIEAANAIEALACWSAFVGPKRSERDPRVRGGTKLRTISKDDLSFSVFRKTSTYVTQPMRMATVQPLRSLGLVESAQDRFSSFACSRMGHEFLELTCSPSNAQRQLIAWVRGKTQTLPDGALRSALAPAEPLPEQAREFLRERIVAGANAAAARRAAALAWVEARRTATTAAAWSEQPPMLDANQWADLREGAYFFAARQAALKLLVQVERLMRNETGLQVLPLDQTIPHVLMPAITAARDCAGAFLDRGRDPTGGVAKTFCTELADPDAALMLGKLVARDGRVLILRGTNVEPGAGFGTVANDAGDAALEADVDGSDRWPAGISPRVNNLFMMTLDLRGELGQWLLTGAEETNRG